MDKESKRELERAIKHLARLKVAYKQLKELEDSLYEKRLAARKRWPETSLLMRNIGNNGIKGVEQGELNK